jgi:hypothetical protein
MNLTRACCALVSTLLIAAALADPPPSGQSSPAPAPAPAPAPQAQIPFANHGGIYDWRVVDDRTVLIQSQSRKWYKASLMSACFQLPFAERLGFKSNPSGSFDKFSSITVRGQTCPVVSLVETTPPPKKPKTSKPDAAASG